MVSVYDTAAAMMALDEDEFALGYVWAHLLEKEQEFEGRFRFNIRDRTDAECFKMFRFHTNDIFLMKETLGIPEKVVCRNGSTETAINALCIVLRRLAYPNRLCDLVSIFGRTSQELSEIFHATLDCIYDNHGDLLSDLRLPFWLNDEHMEQFCQAISRKGSPLDNVWGFIDGTCRPISRPTHYQRQAFSGHHRVHAIKFQSIVTPNGLIANLHGPIEGSHHDAFMLRDSNILDVLDQRYKQDGKPFSIYGDQGYPLRDHLLCPFKGANLTHQQQEFNLSMSRLRESVEWNFKDVISSFAFLDYKKNQKIFLQPIGKFYKVAAFLTNCRTCLYGNQTSAYFQVSPPSVESYVANRVV